MTSPERPVGPAMPVWKPSKLPPMEPMVGRQCILTPTCLEDHAADLFEAFARDEDRANWTYLPYGPFEDRDEFVAWLEQACSSEDPFFHSIIDVRTQRPVGLASYLRVQPEVGVIEVGHLHFSPLMQRTALATEAMYLMMKRAFEELGYRRYEWKCDSLNAKSRRAATRLGFQFEGIFRQATIYKGRSRDTAWYAVLDEDWPCLRDAFEQWLAPENFDAQGRQKHRLETRVGGK